MAPAMPPTMSKQSTPKTMSSRLLTMKFMQRGAAQAATAASDAGSPTTPRTDDEEGSASKRRKVSGAAPSAPNTPITPATPLYDQKALQAAMEEEDRKRKAAIEKRAAELGDSHWVLDGVSASPKNGSRSLNIVQVGFAQIDYPAGRQVSADSPEEEEVIVPAPARFRQFNMKKSKVHNKQEDESSDGDDEDDDNSSDSSDDDNDSEDMASPAASRRKDESDRGRRNSAAASADAGHKRARSSVSTKRSEERKKAQMLASQRRKKDVKLNNLTSISSAGSSEAFQRQSPKFTCHRCGKPGHKAASCPSQGH
ncbi:hypothetical protein B0H66DRAFT_606764 [Apodospora peruviana]|uniref:CCHC-type domain-containing protein n=1 Tax=Apodospora peruviana TaxID=516989 RepID=A0AAE0HV71_9PEZI|nr:hypothetical protein B0H66DRAFT_606764 [Apodospora peruviana]